ncbi:MAG: hypothetical protein H7645_02980 [Candidatus Heimdallarchaeota archaeon]|nr:hypothetical protein [Candidatus Heimdallarchaeota archaeon]MCK4769280.1 hypothetical protein [Candidatus Heimdallarchaeota archaeon]
MSVRINGKYILIIALFFSPIIIAKTGTGLNSKFVFREVKKEEMNVNIVFVGFDDYYTLEENYEYLPTNVDPIESLHYNNPFSDFPYSEYNISYTFSSLTTVEENGITDYIESIAEDPYPLAEDPWGYY